MLRVGSSSGLYNFDLQVAAGGAEVESEVPSGAGSWNSNFSFFF